MDRDFGPFFLKFSTYFPYNAKLCLNGHEYAKRQLARKGIGFEALDNGVLSCDDPQRLQAICDGLSAEKIDALLRKWLRLLPHPYEARDRPRGTPEKRPMRDTSKPANEIRQDKVVITQGRTSRQRKTSPSSVIIGYSGSTWAEDMAPQGCDQSADPAAGNAWAAQAAFVAFLAAKR